MKRKKKSKITILKEAAEAEWKSAVLKRDKNCQRCGSWVALQAHHVKSRSHLSTKFLLSNGILLCKSCHCWITFADDEIRREFHIKIIGSNEYKRLCDLSKQIKNWTVGALERVIKVLRR
jgi:hypothetical protein